MSKKAADYRKLIKAAMITTAISTAVGVAFGVGFLYAFYPYQNLDKLAAGVVRILGSVMLINIGIYVVCAVALWMAVEVIEKKKEASTWTGTRTYKQTWLTGVFGGLLFAQAAFNFVDIYKDPLHFALRDGKTANIRPEKIADELLERPYKRRSWKELRACIAQIDDEVSKRLEQAGGSQESAKHWKDPTNLPCPPG
jgi:hypothetical protein